ncbi:MAG: polyphosphate--glucose phosphotransferase [Aggregatilineales bacterium]
MEILGIDIGGSGIKGAVVDTHKGILVTERHRIPTPQPSSPDAVSEVVREIVNYFGWRGLVGCTFPAVVKDGYTLTAANVDQAWIGLDAERILAQKTGCTLVLVNDADAAGMAEMAFGAGRGRSGVVFILTFGTGIGSSIFVNGMSMPNSELGHLELGGREVEKWASDRVRKEKGLKWKQWAARVNTYLAYLEFIFSPDLFIIGGGVSDKFDKFGPRLTTRAEVVPAQLLNDAGIVGAALAVRQRIRE